MRKCEIVKLKVLIICLTCWWPLRDANSNSLYWRPFEFEMFLHVH